MVFIPGAGREVISFILKKNPHYAGFSCFVALYFIECVKFPRLIVVHENWQDTGRHKCIAPVIVVQFEADVKSAVSSFGGLIPHQ